MACRELDRAETPFLISAASALLLQQYFTASIPLETDPGEAEFRFSRQVKFVYMLGLRCPTPSYRD